jgi:hypothetical protein
MTEGSPQANSRLRFRESGVGVVHSWSPNEGSYKSEEVLWTPASGTPTLTFDANAQLGDNFHIDVDLVAIYETAELALMAKTKELRDALIADLGVILSANGYDTEIAKVYEQPMLFKEAKLPCAMLVPGEGGTSEVAELTDRQGLCEQTFNVMLLIRDAADPWEAIDDFTDDVRNAVERTDSNMAAVTNVEMHAVTDWSEPVVGMEEASNVAFREVVVTARYLYIRGSL